MVTCSLAAVVGGAVVAAAVVGAAVVGAGSSSPQAATPKTARPPPIRRESLRTSLLVRNTTAPPPARLAINRFLGCIYRPSYNAGDEKPEGLARLLV